LGITGNNIDSGVMQVFKVVFSNGRITCELKSSYEDVYWFGAVLPDNSTSIYVINVMLPWREDTTGLIIDATSASEVKRIQSPIKPKVDEEKSVEGGWRFFKMDQIFCQSDNSTNFYCLVNYEAPFVYEYVLNNKDGSTHNADFYYKLPGYMPMYLHGSSDYFVQMTESNHFKETTYVVYKRLSKGGTPDVYYTQDGDAPRTFCMTSDKDGQTRLQLATGFENAPLFFLNVGPFMLNISEGANISKAILNIDGLPGQTHVEIRVADIVGQEILGPANWWPFAILLALLLVIALVYIGYNNFKANSEVQTVDGEQADKYVSLKPEKEETA
jgi:hypothetical protein